MSRRAHERVHTKADAQRAKCRGRPGCQPAACTFRHKQVPTVCTVSASPPAVCTLCHGGVPTVCTPGAAAVHRVHSSSKTSPYRVRKRAVSVHGAGPPVPESVRGGGCLVPCAHSVPNGSLPCALRACRGLPCALSVPNGSLPRTQTGRKCLRGGAYRVGELARKPLLLLWLIIKIVSTYSNGACSTHRYSAVYRLDLRVRFVKQHLELISHYLKPEMGTITPV